MSCLSRFRLFCREVLPRITAHVLMLIFAGIAIYQFWICGKTGNPFLIIFNVLLAAASAIVAGIFFSQLYVPAAAEWLTFSLLFPRRYLKKAPRSLSPIRGMIASGRFREAENQLLELRQENPDQAEMTLLLMELYAERFHQPQQAAAAAETYFASGAVRKDRFHILILMRYADLLQGTERETDLIKRLQTELKQRRLTPSESSSIQTRLNRLCPHYQQSTSRKDKEKHHGSCN